MGLRVSGLNTERNIRASRHEIITLVPACHFMHLIMIRPLLQLILFRLFHIQFIQ